MGFSTGRIGWRPLLLALAGVWIVGLTVSMPRLPVMAARTLLGLSLLGATAIALAGIWRRTQVFPDEAWSWKMMAAATLLGVLSTTLIVFRRGTPAFLPVWDPLMILFIFVATIAGTLALLRLPLAARHPEGFRLHLLGALVFGSSLAVLTWILGLWQAAKLLSFLDRGVLLTTGLHSSIMGGLLAYQMVDNPQRLRGPLRWLIVGLILGTIPTMFALSHRGALGSTFPSGEGFYPVFIVSLAAAVWHPAPAEGCEKPGIIQDSMLNGLLSVPYLGSALCLVWAVASTSHSLLIPLAGFLAVSTLLVIYQLETLKEVRKARNLLDQRVRLRTLELERAQSILLTNERMNSIGLLGAGMAHDLNNSLGVILSSVELAQLHPFALEAPVKDNLVRIEMAAQHSAELGRRLMAFARQERTPEEVFDLGLLLVRELDLLGMLLPSCIRLTLDPGKEPFPVRGNCGQIQQVLINLVTNSRDAIPAAGSVHIGLCKCFCSHGPVAEMTVSDSGCGIPSELLERVFEPLFTTKCPGKGTGLGLASVKVVIEGMGGVVDIKSTLGHGTTIRMLIPLSE